ncbi:TATA box-binding protein-associated factor, RNA polymerase I, subunit C isoform X2 [Hypomesus transpacificus]|uniref:TATA box-binding protein-associated factor, RNA polymerase I, subunit C isoform X2 n=1 Tax=Hypomesus transpacificus TaxID=137520 RepID=UPI001F077DFF|nr:TATA box-binding protein-associated factor, RNA polymerase I, subunit C isoform X2 [Hypomesus transpacificus]
MDYTFPPELFTSYFHSGPPNSEFAHNVGGWGVYGQVKEASSITKQHGTAATLPEHTQFATKHQMEGETWLPVESLTLPLFPPKRGRKWHSTALSDPLDFSEHMQDYYLHRSQDAFYTMSQFLEENLHSVNTKGKTSVLSRTQGFMETLKYKKCAVTYLKPRIKAYHNLLSDVIYDIPPELLAHNLYEELTQQRELEQFSEVATGGALCYIPFSQLNNTQQGCLLYPGDPGLHSLNFHRLALEFHAEGPPCIDSSLRPFSFQLDGTVRQICTGTPQDTSNVGVRSDYTCGVWMVSEKNEPKTVEVIQTKEVATCLSISPHIQGELLVASESGVAHLWTVGKGLQKFRKEDSNMYFNARSAWRWCDFTGHPRVMIYADRTGVELTDIRTNENCSHTLFRIGQTPDCKTGERVIMSKYLREVHMFHHLITTQFSAYILDERFPCIPMVKWDHMMEDPPMFAHVLASNSSGAGTTKVVLGSQRSQELTLLQYSGGRQDACCTRGPPAALLRPRDSLSHLPAQIPHRHHIAQQRLALKAAGVTCIQQNQGARDICVLQLTEAGDVFYQMLRPQVASCKEDVTTPTQNSEDVGLPTSVQHRSSIDTLISQDMSVDREKSKGSLGSTSPGPTVDCGFERRGTDLPCFKVVVNDDPEETDLGLSGFELDNRQGVSSSASRPAEASTACAARPSLAKAGDDALLKWKIWLFKLVRKNHRKQRFPHNTIRARGLLDKSGETESRWREPMEEDKRDSLRRDVKEAMKRGKFLVHGATHLPPMEPVSVPGSVEPSAWTDDLSQRLSVSWEGGWKVWWEESLGMNQESKMQALRRKRRRQKMARAHNRLELSGSFTTSVSYQSDMDDLSGYTSATSQSAASDSEGTRLSLFSDDLSEPGSYKTSQMHGRTARVNEEYQSSLQEASRGLFDEGVPSAPLATSSQVSSVFPSQRTPRVGGSSQTSLSQLKRKKARMGF